MIFQSRLTPALSGTKAFTPCGRTLQRKCACGGTPGPSGECAECKRKRLFLQPKLAINQPGDRYEQEADRMADLVMSGRSANGSIALSSKCAAVQREGEQKKPPKPNNYDEAAKKIGDALQETPVGKQLKAKAEELGKDFLSSVEGKVVAGSALGGALAAIIATNSELPVPIPELPLDFIAPGLKAKLTWQGPVQKPTNLGLTLTSKGGVSLAAGYTRTAAAPAKPAEDKVGLTLSFPLGDSSPKKKTSSSDSDKIAAETAQLTGERDQLREAMKTPGERGDDKAFWDSYWRSKASDPLNPLQLGKKKEDSLLMRDAKNAAGRAAAPPIVHDVLAESGQPLETPTRAFMEARFGYDFSRVRVHSDARASESARAVNAHAYTVGNHVVFDAGRYAPATPAGQRLLGHELTHVVQQSAGVGDSLQREDKPERIDVAIVFGDEEDAMVEGRSYAPTALRVTSGSDAKTKLLALGKPIGRIYVVSHSNRSGEVQVISGIGTISWAKLSDLSADLKGMPVDKAPLDIDFRGCKLGEAPDQIETFRKNVGAASARGMTCWSIVQVVTPLVLPGNVQLTDPSQIPAGKEKDVDEALVRQINALKSDNKHAVKNCIEGLKAGETADANLAKIKKLYFEHKGNLAAVWASPEYNHDWQQGSMCVKDLTDSTSPCKIVTKTAPPPPAAAPAPAPAPKKGAMVAPSSSDTQFAGDAVATQEGERVA